MSDKKQTAVSWIEQQLKDILEKNNIIMEDSIWNHAQQMEREHIVESYCSGFEASGEGWNGEYGLKDMRNICEEIKAEQYYEQTYGGKNEK
jgi:uncharacterized protein YxjI